MTCECPTYSADQPDLPCPVLAEYKHNGVWLCEYHFRQEMGGMSLDEILENKEPGK